jgi:hypothetical protein
LAVTGSATGLGATAAVTFSALEATGTTAEPLPLMLPGSLPLASTLMLPLPTALPVTVIVPSRKCPSRA